VYQELLQNTGKDITVTINKLGNSCLRNEEFVENSALCFIINVESELEEQSLM
jgi:hypothetical protein